VVYPTKDRPFLIEYCIKSSLLQTFSDFELIICDNSKDDETEIICKKYVHDKRIKYFKSGSNLAMGDNWEFAISIVKGKYVTVLTDKTILYKDCLQKSYEYLVKNPVDVINWRDDSYNLINENSELKTGYDKGIFYRKYMPVSPKIVNQQEELIRNFDLKNRRGTEGEKYFWGKICFGFFSKKLIDRIISNEGSFFNGITPDYSSKIRALTYADSIIDIGQSLQLSFGTKISNGNTSSNKAYKAKEFIETYSEEKYITDLPISNLYSSLHNIVAFDFFSSKKSKSMKLNRVNLLKRALEDLSETSFLTKSERINQYILLENEIKKLPLEKIFEIRFEYFKFRIKKLFKILKGYGGKFKRRLFVPKEYPNVIDLIKNL
jgi:glycosyltransferase involved in cell wall biosynthesis